MLERFSLQHLRACVIASATSGFVWMTSSIHVLVDCILARHISVASGWSHCIMCWTVSVSSPHLGQVASVLHLHLFRVSFVPIFPENIFVIPMVLVLFSFAAACANPFQLVFSVPCWLIFPFFCQYWWSCRSCIAFRIVVSNSVVILVPSIQRDQVSVSMLVGIGVTRSA